MNNRDRKKAAAKKHNMDYLHSQANAQDRIEDPDKYRLRISTKSRRERQIKMVGLIGAAAGMGVFIDYPD